MTDKTVDLDQHRGMAAQKATKLRRLLADVEANEKALRVRQQELESHPAGGAGNELARSGRKARYLLNLIAATLAAEDPRRQNPHCCGTCRLRSAFGRKLATPTPRLAGRATTDRRNPRLRFRRSYGAASKSPSAIYDNCALTEAPAAFLCRQTRGAEKTG
jgi:hypothetical protein